METLKPKLTPIDEDNSIDHSSLKGFKYSKLNQIKNIF